MKFSSEESAEFFNCATLVFSPDDLVNAFSSFNVNMDALRAKNEHQFDTVCHSLAQRGYVIPDSAKNYLNLKNFGYFCAKSKDPGKAYKYFNTHTFCVIGLGGTGSIVIQHLVGLGADSYVIVDKDTIESSNFNRQFIYNPSDVGQNKALAARRYIKDRIPSANVCVYESFVHDYASIDKLKNVGDFVFCCIDTPIGHVSTLMAYLRHSKGVPTIQSSVGLLKAYCGSVILPDTTEVVDNFDDHQHGHLLPWSIGITNTLVATQMTKRALDWIITRATGPLLVNQSNVSDWMYF